MEDLRDSKTTVNKKHRLRSWGWERSRPQDFGMVVVGAPQNIMLNYNIKEYEMRTFFQKW